jgi:chromosome segregation ATPase
MYKHIRLFYKDIIGIEFEEDFFKPKEAVEQKNVSEFRKLTELITGIAGQCEKRIDYLHIMQNMDNEESTELFKILTERISAYNDDDVKLKDFSMTEQSYAEEDEQATLYLKIEKLEVENGRLHEEIKSMTNKIDTLTKSNFTYELMLKESESKYQELLNTLDHKTDIHGDNNYEDSVALSIQISELKGKLEAKEKNLQKIKDDKDKLDDDTKQTILQLQKENENMKEKCIKYDVLKEKMERFSIDEINELKSKLVQSDRIIKEQDEKIKKLKNFDVDKVKLLKKIEDLNIELTHHDEKVIELTKAVDHYKDIIIQHENEVKFLKNKLDNQTSQSRTSDLEDSSKVTLHDLEEVSENKKNLMDIEMKLKFAQNDREKLIKDRAELEDKFKAILAELEELKKENGKNAKKLDKYEKFKQERHTYIQKINDLMENLHQVKSESDQLKALREKEIAELNNKFLVKIYFI